MAETQQPPSLSQIMLAQGRRFVSGTHREGTPVSTAIV
jgi:hypothetical protein